MSDMEHLNGKTKHSPKKGNRRDALGTKRRLSLTRYGYVGCACNPSSWAAIFGKGVGGREIEQKERASDGPFDIHPRT